MFPARDQSAHGVSPDVAGCGTGRRASGPPARARACVTVGRAPPPSPAERRAQPAIESQARRGYEPNVSRFALDISRPRSAAAMGAECSLPRSGDDTDTPLGRYHGPLGVPHMARRAPLLRACALHPRPLTHGLSPDAWKAFGLIDFPDQDDDDDVDIDEVRPGIPRARLRAASIPWVLAARLGTLKLS